MAQPQRPAPVRDPDKFPPHPDRAILHSRESSYARTNIPVPVPNKIGRTNNAQMLDDGPIIFMNMKDLNFPVSLIKLITRKFVWSFSYECMFLHRCSLWIRFCLSVLCLLFQRAGNECLPPIVSSMKVREMMDLEDVMHVLGFHWIAGLSRRWCAPLGRRSILGWKFFCHTPRREVGGSRYQYAALRLRGPTRYVGMYPHSADPPSRYPPEYYTDQPATKQKHYPQPLFQIHTRFALSQAKLFILVFPSIVLQIQSPRPMEFSLGHALDWEQCIKLANDLDPPAFEELATQLVSQVLLSQPYSGPDGVPSTKVRMNSSHLKGQDSEMGSPTQLVNVPMVPAMCIDSRDPTFWGAEYPTGNLDVNEFPTPRPFPSAGSVSLYSSQMEGDTPASTPEMTSDSSVATMSPPSSFSTPSEVNGSPSTSISCSPTQPYKCQHHSCERFFAKRHEMRRHFREVHRKPYHCPYPDCPGRFSSKKDQKRHVNSKLHLNSSLFKCPQCEKGDSRKDNLRTHMRDVHGIDDPQI
ncbi:hypothetical protein BDZ91DRAFT_843581 [Kalaharituber pfeilii]|nr:hypothetical protein BDZ91DRAFT_843581 [Kalaharituber pfeilii]